MKQKAIEQIPYITVPARKKGKEVKYIVTTACVEIGGVPHIIAEAYENKKGCLGIPKARYVATRKDYGVYIPAEGEWHRQRIANMNSGWFCWNGENYGDGYRGREKENILNAPEDLDRIKSYFKDIRAWSEEDWWEYFGKNERNIRNEAITRRHKRRMEALEDRNKNTPPLPEGELLGWSDANVFREKHFLYYKKHGRRATVCCSKCGGVDEGIYRDGDSYEDQFKRHIDEPHENSCGICPLCGAGGTYKPQGRAGGIYQETGHIFVLSRYKTTGAVVRYVKISKEWVLEEFANDALRLEMHGAYERLAGVEIARTYYEKNKKPQTDFQKHNPYTGTDFWDDCNLSGMSNIAVSNGRLYLPSIRELEGTVLQYSAIDRYVAAAGETNVKEYMNRYMWLPQIEMLVKLGLYGVVNEMVNFRCGVIADLNADRPEKFLGIRREHLPLLIRRQGAVDMLKTLQIEKNLDQNWTEKQCEALCGVEIGRYNIHTALQFMTVQKLINRVEKYAGCKFMAECGRAHGILAHTLTTYLDYLQMRQQLGYDLNNTVYQYPRDLNAAHGRMVAEMDDRKLDTRMAEVAQKFPGIRAAYRKLRRKYFYEDGEYVIRPARSAEEIVKEGRTLHHCVGGDNYLDRHNRRVTVILMLRFKKTPDVPYITVEIRDTTICQWYGAYDNKPDKENMQKWIDRYVTLLKCGRTGAGTGENQIKTKVPVTA